MNNELIDVSIYENNILKPSEYSIIKLIDLDTELRGSSDYPDRDAVGMIFRVENKVKSYLLQFNFSEDMIFETKNSLLHFKLAIMDQIERELQGFKEDPSRNPDLIPICAEAKGNLRKAGLMNYRRGC